VYAAAPVVGGSTAVAAFERGVALPSGSGLRDVDTDRVIQAVGDHISRG
jgi:dTDP-4-amino-4,6-dideoxygalactose transaminase